MDTKDIVIIVLIFAVVLIVVGVCFGLFHTNTNTNTTNLTDNNTTSGDIAYLVKEGKQQIKQDQSVKKNTNNSNSNNAKSSGTDYSNVKYYDSNDPYVDKVWDAQSEKYVYITKSGKHIDPNTGKEPYEDIS